MKINKLLIATHNLGKYKELKNKLSSLNIEIKSLDDLGIREDYEETGKSYEENALGKARFYYKLTKIPTLADDSGLSVDALQGATGINSRSWPGYRGTDEELLEMLLEKLRGIPNQERTAKFVTVLALVDGQTEFIARGEIDGTITHQAVCDIEPGLPYSVVFYPDGLDKVFSQLTTEEKNTISHRGQVLKQIINKLK